MVAYGGMLLADRLTGTLRAGTTPTTIWLFLLAMVGYAGLVAVVVRHPDVPSGFGSLLWVAPIGYRLLLLATDPTLSDDVYRYLWDGHQITQGINPYRYAISAPEVDGFAIAARDLANNPDLASPYLPTNQALFAVLALVAPSVPLVIQVVMVGFELTAAVVLRRLLVLADLPPSRVALFLWHPLAVVETAHSGHFDALLVLLTLVAFLAVHPDGLARGRLWSPVALALATLTRPVPALVAPVFFWRWTWTQRFGFAAVGIALMLPFRFGAGSWGLFGEPTGTGVFGSARVYSGEFRFNAVVAEQLERWMVSLTGNPDAFRPTAVGLIGVVLVGVLLAARPGVGPDPDSSAGFRRTLRLAMVPLAAYVLLTPVLHPWYLLLAVALAPFLVPTMDESRRWWFALAPLGYLSGAVAVSYMTYIDPDAFGELVWVRRVEWWPTLALLALGAAVVGGRGFGGLLRRDDDPIGRSDVNVA